ncbi:hypothetical protein FSP39_013594 [Pinctada imbricata]|uniref:Uncharacterized protein n=1 Tax=Pinctada imbricata TaxID=66713 RepID=A0AA89C1E9_PINIB|nr:hypothetical protein FSP39_013594 [Pinctada imbricata]
MDNNFRGQKRKREEEPDILCQAPREISVVQYAQSRASEIQALSQEVNKKNASSFVNTFIPRHMRRRAMSHNVKRFPRRIRDKLNVKGIQTKRPSRKYRRRPKNLLAEYNRRQRKHVWMETHIWHAKRFIMANKWGYRIPLHPTQKGTRAAYRATQRSCQIMDMSYLCCIEIVGIEENILQGLDHLTSLETGILKKLQPRNVLRGLIESIPRCDFRDKEIQPDCQGFACTTTRLAESWTKANSGHEGPTFRAKSYIRGLREGSLVLYHKDSYPYNAIGYVTFMWQPIIEQLSISNSQRTLWIWCHPSYYQEVWDELKFCYVSSENREAVNKYENLTREEDSVPLTLPSEPEKKNTTKTVVISAEKGTIGSYLKTASESVENDESSDKKQNGDSESANSPKFMSCSIGHVTLTSLKDCLVRHRLTGPRSQAILASVLRPSDIELDHLNSTEQACQVSVELESQSKKSTVWWQDYYSNPHHLSVYKAQRQFVERELYSCPTPSDVPPHAVIGMVVRDPRVLRPPVRTMVESDIYENSCSGITQNQLTPEIASSSIWDRNIRDCVKTTKMTDLKLHQIRSQQLVPGSPLDLGKDESRIPIMLVQNPGCLPNVDMSQAKLNYGSGWDVILPAGWSRAFWIAFIYNCTHAVGLRESQSLAQEQQVLHSPEDYPDTKAGQRSQLEVQEGLQAKHDKRPPAKNPNYTKLGRLYPFDCPWQQLLTEWRERVVGCDDNNSENFYVLRNKSDLKFLTKCFSSKNQRNTKSIRQSKHKKAEDVSPEMINDQLNEMMSRHRMVLVPVRVTMATKGAPEAMATVSIPTDEDLQMLHRDNSYSGPEEQIHQDKVKQAKKEQKLRAKKLNIQVSKRKQAEVEQTTQNETKIFSSCSRRIMGYLSHGGFALSSGGGSGLGFCALSGLAELYSIHQNNTVLIRNPKSFKYRFAHIQIICS